jgi:hypothetical protein
VELANSIVTLQPGMYILRHPKTGMPPISISRAAANAAHTGQIQALFTPASQGSVLRDGRDCIVMQVLDAPADLLVTAYLEKSGAAVPALKIDKIRLDGDDTGTAMAPQVVPPKGLSLIGHLERRGDVLAKPGETLGSPESDLRLEGLQIMWPDKPEGLDLTYSANIEGAGETPKAGTGQFCGTRNAARRLVGVTFGLTGKLADQYKIDGEAHFSGGFKTVIQPGAALQGPTGVEHLTALRINVKKKNPWEASPRTRVLKSRGRK